MTKKYKDLTRGPIARQLLALCLPMFFGMFAIFFFGVTDAYFLGKLGAQELTAMGFVLPILALFMSFSRGMSEGAISLVARKFGADDMDDAKLFSTSILLFALIVAMVFVVFGLVYRGLALDFLGARGAVKDMAMQYLLIWFGGMVFLVVPMVGNGFIRAAGDTKWPAMLMVFAAVGNIILDPIFIFGLGPIPAMGMKGAAVASIVSRSFTLIASLYLVYYRYRLICFARWQWFVVWGIWKRFIAISLPASLNFLIIPVTMALVTRLMARYSEDHVAGFGLAHQIESLGLLTFYAVAVGMSSFVGQNYGAGKRARLRSAFALATKVNMAMGALLVLVYVFWAEVFVGCFQDTPGIVNIASSYLVLVSVGFGFEGVYLFCVNTLNVTGKALYATLLVVFRMFVLYVPLAYGLTDVMGHYSVFLAALVSNVGAGLFGRYMIHRLIILEKI